MKISLPVIFLILPLWCAAETIDVFFGTIGKIARGIYYASFDTETGRLSEAKLVAQIASPGFLAMDSENEFLYSTGVRDKMDRYCVAAYKIEENGKLDYLNSRATGDGMSAHLAVHPSNKFLLTAQYGGGSVSVFPIKPDGSLGNKSQHFEHKGGSNVVAARQDKPYPHWTGFSPDGAFAFVPDLGLDQIVIYRVDPLNASISKHGLVQTLPGGGPRHMRFSVGGKYIYLLQELNLSVSTFAFDPETGTAALQSTAQALSEEAKSRQNFNSSSEILVHPNGKFVYSANRGDDSITLYWADPQTGRLKAKQVENIRGAFPRNINLDPEGKWLLAGGQHSNTVSVFAVDQESGHLIHQMGKGINVPQPTCILFRRGEGARP